ncbi:hypothetical protein MMC26_000745, partial [Xylographa opegraphella]|nr:hypothetical protein [Xylographa opegraphella]
GYHIYRDVTGFSYDITLARSDLTTNTNARYVLKLYESHVSPSKYACFSSYSSPTAGTATHVLAPLGSSFSLAIEQFVHFFKLKTKLEWKERNGTLDKESETAFEYTPPAEGEPWGVVDPESIW